MSYHVQISPAAFKDVQMLPRNLAESIRQKIDSMQQGLPASVKHLHQFDIGYRLRLGDYRILFDLAGSEIIIRRILHRRHAYASSHGKKRKRQH
jgi:mRNA interferase RelE/StbE